MRLANVQVLARLRDFSVQNVLPSSRTRASIEGNCIVVKSDEEASPLTRYEFDGCFQSRTGPAELADEAEVGHLLKQLLHGISVGIFSLGLEGEKPGTYGPFMVKVLLALQAMIEEGQAGSEGTVSLSFGIYGVSDASCVDLLTYHRKDLCEVAELQGWSELVPIDGVSAVVDSVQQGYSLPCIVLLRLLHRPAAEGAPATMSTLALGDFGPITGGSSLEKSFAQLKSTIITMDQSIVELGSLAENKSYLSTFVEDYLGGDGLCMVIADVPSAASLRSMQAFVQFLSALRRIKNRPTANVESPEMVELGILVKVHHQLEAEHRSIRKELRGLQKELRASDSERLAIVALHSRTVCASETQKWQHEYDLACLDMAALQVRERIRACEISLVGMDHERLVLLAEMDRKQREILHLDRLLAESIDERVAMESHYASQVGDLKDHLAEAHQRIVSSETERSRMEGEVAVASSKVAALTEQIKLIERERAVSISRFESMAADDARIASSELARLKLDLSSAHDSEAKLQRRLAELDRLTLSNQSVVRDFESKISSLRMENAALHAKLEVLSIKPQSPHVNRTMEVMEEKWRAEKNAMHLLMEDMRRMVNERTGAQAGPSIAPPSRQPLPHPVIAQAHPAPPPIVLPRRSNVAKSGGQRSEASSPPSSPRSTSDASLLLSRNGGPISVRAPVARGRPRSRKDGGILALAPLPIAAVGRKGGPLSRRKEIAVKGSSTGAGDGAGGEVESSQTRRSRRQSAVGSADPATPKGEGRRRDSSSVEGGRRSFGGGSAAIKGPTPAAKERRNRKSVSFLESTPVKGSPKEQAEASAGAEEDEVEIPPTPPPSDVRAGVSNSSSIGESTTALPSSGAAVVVSPVKTWKAASFIPGVAAKGGASHATSGGSNENTSGAGIMANFSFAQQSGEGKQDGAAYKRIKLPERNRAPQDASSVPLVGGARDRRNVDPNVYSTIMSSFNL